jgi:hypothetical protein
MTELIITLGENNRSWPYIQQLIKVEDWTNIFVIGNKVVEDSFRVEGKVINFIVINEKETVKTIVQNITRELKEKITGTEVALNFVSGKGKLHMALIPSVLKLGLGIRFVVLNEERNMEEIKLF